MIVADLQAGRARIVDVPEALAVLIRDRPACRGLGLLPAPARPPTVAAITLPAPAFRGGGLPRKERCRLQNSNLRHTPRMFKILRMVAGLRAPQQ